MKAALLAAAITEDLEGKRRAGHFLARLRTEVLDADELLRAVLLAQSASSDRLRGFCRRIQQQLERES